MRARLAIVLIALLAVVGVVGVVVVPSEAVMAEPSGGVVDQVASYRQASGLTRDGGRTASLGQEYRLDRLLAPTGIVLAVLVTAAGGLGVLDASRLRRRRERWSLPEAVARAGAPWRAPPRPV